jgi:hypothetical protein
VYEPERPSWLPHVTVVRFGERPRLSPPLPGLGTSLRPVRLFTYPSSGRQGANTLSSRSSA